MKKYLKLKHFSLEIKIHILHSSLCVFDLKIIFKKFEIKNILTLLINLHFLLQVLQAYK